MLITTGAIKRSMTKLKKAVSISLGDSQRNSSTIIQLFDTAVEIQRIGTDGDFQKAKALFEELDGKVDAFGFGGAILGVMVAQRWYTLHSVKEITAGVKHTPIADGTGLKMTLEARAAQALGANLNLAKEERKAFLTSVIDRYGLFKGFDQAGYTCILGDLLFTLGFNIPIYSETGLVRVARSLLPIMSRLPFQWIYPTGDAQKTRTPKWQKYFDWAKVIAGDCHYITHYMPDELQGKIIVTNTTTPEDRDLFKKAGVKNLITTTPIFNGRSYGTNMLEAAILAAVGWDKPVNYGSNDGYFDQMNEWTEKLNLQPQFQEL